MMNIKKTPVLIVAVVLVAIVFRLYRLGDIPVGLHRDEAFLGYNAYSILKTGRDMSGDILPLHFESFLYSPGGYSYASIPFIAMFGLSAFSVRLASALFGVATVVGVYGMVRELFSFKSQSHTSYMTYAESVSVIASFLLAVSPWHINLSRTATENTVVTFFIVTGVWLYVLFIRKRRLLLLIFSCLVFSITLTLYQAPRAFLPLFVPVMFFIYPVRSAKAGLLAVLLYIVFIVLPVVYILRSPDLSLRIRTVGIFGNGEVPLLIDEQIREDGVNSVPVFVARVFHNKLVGYASAILTNYTDHFSYRFLFTDEAKPERYHIPSQGLLYVFMLPFLVYGAASMVKKYPRPGLLMLSWIVLVPIGSALTFDDVPNMQRTLFMVPPLVILTAYGIVEMYYRTGPALRLYGSGIVAMCALYAISSYAHAYVIHQVVHKPFYRQEGYRELVSSVTNLLPSYEKAVVTNYESAPAIFFLFYNTYDPSMFREQTANVVDYDRVSFGPYEFSGEECPLHVDPETKLLTGGSNILYVNYATCPTASPVHVVRTISRGDGTDVFRIVDVDNQ